jgi:hypothetical protein
VDLLTVEFYQNFKEQKPMLLKLFHKTQGEGILPNSFYKANIPPIPKSDKVTPKNCRSISLMNLYGKILKKVLNLSHLLRGEHIWEIWG